MKDIYLWLLCALVAMFVIVYRRREHLTVEKRIEKIEKSVHKLKDTLESQEKRMGQASSQAADAKARLDANVKL